MGERVGVVPQDRKSQQPRAGEYPETNGDSWVTEHRLDGIG